MIHRTIIFCVGFYGCESWFLTLGEERRRKLRVFGNRVLRKIFGPKGAHLRELDSGARLRYI
jgi:hypothetical protein